MADIKLFNINGKVKEYQSGTVTLEKEIQTVIENNMETFIFLLMEGEWIAFEEGFSRDVTNIGHWGCGAVELHIRNSADLEKSKTINRSCV